MKSIFLHTFLLLSVLLSAQNNDNDRAFIEKAKPELIRDFNNGRNEFWIVFNEQADVSGAYALKTKEEKGAYVFKTLNETADRVQRPFIALLQSKRANYQSFWITNSIFVNGDITLAKEFAAYPEVKELLANARFVVEKSPTIENPEPAQRDATSTRSIAWGVKKIKAPDVWALGYKGQGVTVSGEDTGYDWTHKALKGKYRGWNGSTADHNYNWHDAIHSGNGGKCGLDSKEPCDDDTHGTHTMGTMLGDDGAGNQIGVAPEAKWIGCRNMDTGAGTLTQYDECFQWFLAPTDLSGQNPDPSKAPHVINNSWGCPTSEGCNTSNFATMEACVNNLVAAGVVVVVSAGNDGSSCKTVNGPAAIFEKSFTVGSTTSSDAMSSFSSRGPVTVDGSNRVKPNVCAPGSGIYSSVPGGGYGTKDGTSMAGPHVAGAVAVLISAVPSLAGNVSAIEDAFEKTAVHISNSQTCGSTSPSTFPNNTIGFGRIDLLAAVNYAITNSVKNIHSAGNVVGFPSPANDKFFAVIGDFRDVTAQVNIYNTVGQIMATHTLSMNNHTLEIPVSELASGVYMYNIKVANNIYMGKVVKQ